MSESTDCKKQSKPSKRRESSEQVCSSLPGKTAKVQEGNEQFALDSRGGENGGTAQTGGTIGAGGKRAHEAAYIYIETKLHQNKKACMKNYITPGSAENTDAQPTTSSGRVGPTAVGDAGDSERPMDAAVAGASGRGSVLILGPGHAGSHQQPDWAAIAAAEALASLTRGDEGDMGKERSHTGNQAEIKKNGKRSGKLDSKAYGLTGSKTRAAAADSSTSLPEGGAALDTDTEEEEDDDSLLSSSTPDFSSESEDVNTEDAECAIVSVKIVPETRQAVAQIARLQMQLETLERKGARQHQRLELRLSKQRRLHLDQRGAFIKDIPGFWVTALLNHPQLSGHIDENDEDILSYMTNLEIENNGLGYKIGFHFKRNPYFQNSFIVKELHLAMDGSPMSFSNPILWHRGQNLMARGRLLKGLDTFDPNKSFFTWFSDHSTPDRDEIAEILKNDLYRNPLRYYQTPLWESRVNSSVLRVTNHINSSECVVISDSEDNGYDGEEEGGPDATWGEHEQEERSFEEDEEVLIDGSEEDGIGQQKDDEEELDVEEVEGAEGSESAEGTELEEEEDIEVDGGEKEES